MTTALKETVRDLLDRMPDDADWDDFFQALYERMAIERALAQGDAGEVMDLDEVAAEHGITQ